MIRSDLAKCANQNGMLDGVAYSTNDAMAVDFAYNGRVVVFDTETTGSGVDDEILQLSAIEFVKGQKMRTFNAFIKPVLDHYDIATCIHGITWELLEKSGRPPVEVLSEFFDFLGRDVMIVSHNLRFDMRMLRQECALCKDVRWKLCNVRAFDTLTRAYKLYPNLSFRVGGCGYSLEVLIDEFELAAENSHCAEDDADACAKLFYHMIDSMKVK